MESFWKWVRIENIQRIIRRLPSSNLKINLRGNINNDELLEYYKNNLIDIFINTSDSEGLPVSIIEAQNFGIPVIAPALGGIPEIVNGNNELFIIFTT
ncbi:MAG: glycosyltransferase [Ignavibacteriales bacterium]|nr:glycosyltransferase [Ignavibacteriales bacterium]